MENKQAGVWVDIIEGENKTLPPEGKEVIFDGTEIPPIWGSIKYNGILPCILCYDSSGEEDYEDVWQYDRWLDESQPIPVNQDEAKKIWEQACKVTLYEVGKVIGYPMGDETQKKLWAEMGEVITQMPVPEIPEKYLQHNSIKKDCWEEFEIDFMNDNGLNWEDIKSKYSIQLKSSPSPTPVQEGLNIRKEFKNWCRLTKKTGRILIGNMDDFFDYLEEQPSQESGRDKEEVKKDEIWNDLGNNLREAKTEEPEW